MPAASIAGAPPPGRHPLLLPRPFQGRIIIRQVMAEAAAMLWVPTVRPYRWSSGFPALYASLDMDVAVAERLKRTGLRRTRLAVGVARASIQKTVPLTRNAALAASVVRFMTLSGSITPFPSGSEGHSSMPGSLGYSCPPRSLRSHASTHASSLLGIDVLKSGRLLAPGSTSSSFPTTSSAATGILRSNALCARSWESRKEEVRRCHPSQFRHCTSCSDEPAR